MTTPVTTPNLYAYVSASEDNAPFTVSPADRLSFDDLPAGWSNQSVVVRDINTGEHWRIWRETCGLKCYCAARAELIHPYIGPFADVIATGQTVVPPMTVADWNDGGDY